MVLFNNPYILDHFDGGSREITIQYRDNMENKHILGYWWSFLNHSSSSVLGELFSRYITTLVNMSIGAFGVGFGFQKPKQHPETRSRCLHMIQQLSLRGTERKERTYTRDLNPGCLLTHQTSLRIESSHSCCMIACFSYKSSFQSNLTVERVRSWSSGRLDIRQTEGNFQLQKPKERERSSLSKAFGTCISSSKSGGGLVARKKGGSFPTPLVFKKSRSFKTTCSFSLFPSQIGERYNKKL